ncbi:hypothetical protein SDC9_181067 [bioreactor metagenome]|uniref:Uncharacterized protein n=1 Tax=bioreactor metagenome TaxID=1076179 RepID=A0A645H3H6_9ZZZZ
MQIIGGGLQNGRHILLHDPRAGKRGDAEHHRNPGRGLLDIVIGRNGLDINGRLRLADRTGSQRRQAILEILHKNRFKGTAVETFERKLSGFNKQYFPLEGMRRSVHTVIPAFLNPVLPSKGRTV